MMNDWLSEIEEKGSANTYDSDIRLMARVIRELGEVGNWANKLVVSMNSDSPDKVTLVGLILGNLRLLLDNLSDNAKKLIGG